MSDAASAYTCEDARHDIDIFFFSGRDKKAAVDAMVRVFSHLASNKKDGKPCLECEMCYWESRERYLSGQ